MNPRLTRYAEKLARMFTTAGCPVAPIAMKSQPPQPSARKVSLWDSLFSRKSPPVEQQAPDRKGWLVTSWTLWYEETEWGPRNARGYKEETSHRDIYLLTDGKLVSHTYTRKHFPPNPADIEGSQIAPTTDTDISYLDHVNTQRSYKQVKQGGSYRSEGWSMEAKRRRYPEDGHGFSLALTELRRRLLNS